MKTVLPGILDEAQRLVRAAAESGLALSLLGGVAARLQASEVPASLQREYKDLDVAVAKGHGRPATKLLETVGYEPNTSFNAMNGRERLLFHDVEHRRQVDVFVGSFRMCHEVPLAGRLRLGQATVPLAELLLTKLQIIELNEKDVRDTILLFYGHDVLDHDHNAINGQRVADLCAEDWGLWRTVTQNLARCGGLLGNYEMTPTASACISERIAVMRDWIASEPKTRRWKLRAKIGDRKRWYDLPEEVTA